MSGYYTVKEHLVVKNIHEGGNGVPVAQMKQQLSLLGELTLTDEVSISSIEVKTDGTTLRFSGKEIAAELHVILSAMDQGNSVEIIVDYGIRWDAAQDPLNVRLLAVCNCVKALQEKAPEQAENVFYSMYSEVDCDCGGELVAYGKKNGKIYHGMVEPAPAASLEDGIWENNSTTIIFEDECTDETDIAVIEQIGCIFAGRFPDASITEGENSETLYADFFPLRSKADLEYLTEQYARLLRAADSKCSIVVSFTDLSGKDAAVLELGIKADDSYTLTIARI